MIRGVRERVFERYLDVYCSCGDGTKRCRHILGVLLAASLRLVGLIWLDIFGFSAVSDRLSLVVAGVFGVQRLAFLLM
ncbi:SWIM zinc finger family protein [Haloarcula sp. S1AR25-4]|uniref:SWIM zinc finger family protein n=1 Tax=Haloarcula sp. S1AR25-4 TaxID=2950538 RepID=UPI0037BF2048